MQFLGKFEQLDLPQISYQFYSRRGWGVLPRGIFTRAAVGSFGAFPGTRGFIHAAVAGCACFPGTPAEERVHIKMEKRKEAKPQRAKSEPANFLAAPPQGQIKP
ncbi:hypothetical protein MNBD_ALPHA12-167 [hydrothermal vent metagenome]|uniref:Uncharacterized protein n=1 Tax=hydrothermal vent metagenome TaxID=652676 RepID=A0A3B0TWJ0_9ZZZZ